jgi:hypothetical protein
MLDNISYFLIFGIPFIVYLGIITFFMIILTAVLAILKRRGKMSLSIKWHFRLAYVSLFLAILHSFLGVLIYF